MTAAVSTGLSTSAASAAVADGAALPRARRLDWRFLLPRARFGRVAIIGRPDRELGEALAAEATAVHPPNGSRDADLLVGVSPSVAELQVGLDGVVADGVAYLELSGYRARWQIRRELRRAGWRELATHLQWPCTGRATAFVPAGFAPAQQRAAATRTGREAPLLRALARRGWLAAVSRSASVVAVGPHWAGATTPVIVSGVAPCAEQPVLLFTPRHAASRHVIALSGDVVVKCPRLPDDDAELRNEQAVLARLDEIGAVTGRPRLVPTAPVPFTRLVETRIEGSLVTRGDAGREPDRLLTEIGTWLDQLHVGPASSPATDGRLDRLVRAPLANVARRLDPADPLSVDLERTLAVAEDLGRHRLPVVFEHGDVRPPNLLRTAHGLAVIDWELAEPEGLPLHDLLYALDFVTTSASEHRSRPAIAPTELLSHALAELALDNELRPALTVVSWARRAVSLALRSAAGPERPLDAAWWSGTHPVRRWREALAVLDGKAG